ncbi:MAG: sodium:solute symporter family transporter [Panacagrimonas sp.]
MQSLATLDYVIVGVYLLIVIAVAVRVTRRAPDADELFLAGRSLGWGVIGLSLFASNISSTTLIGLPGAAWEHGISVANYEWMASLVLIVSMVYVVPLLLGNRVSTVPEMLERRFDSRLRKYLSAVSVVLGIFLDAAGSLYAGALVLQLFFPGLELWMSCAGIAMFAGLYTAAGGLRAVAYTDVIQTVVLLGGSIALALIVFGEFDYSWTQVQAAVPAEKLSLLRPMDDPALPWLGTLIGLPILGFYYWTMNQYVAQRLLGARDMRAAGYGAVLAAFLKLLPLFFMVLPGAMAVVLLPDLDRPDRVFPALVAEYAPAGLAGLILAGLLAAIMSSVDSALNSSSTLLTLDFIQPRRPQMTVNALGRLGRVLTLSLVAVAAIWAPFIGDFPGLFAYLQQGFTYAASPLVATFLVGLCSRRVAATPALLGTATGHAISVMLFIATQLGWLSLHFTIVAGVLLVATVIAIYLFQFLLQAEPDAVALTAVRRERMSPVPIGVRRSAAVVVVLTLLLVWIFR